jgi:low temperature requirement protein LtrA
VPSLATLGGTALYLLAHVAFRWRNVHRFSSQRLLGAIVVLALTPVAIAAPALVTLGVLAAVLIALIGYETVAFAQLRERLRHQLAREPAAR